MQLNQFKQLNGLPLVSVIMPTHNRAEWLRKSIGSVLKQSYRHWELIIWDDGSTDNTKELVGSFNDDRIKYFYGENHGVSYARNRAIEMSQGKYLAFLDSDDEWVDNKTFLQIGILEDNPDINIIFGNFLNKNLLTGQDDLWFELKASGLSHLKTKPIRESGFLITGGMPESLLIANFVATDSVIVQQEYFEKAGYFNEKLRNAEDFELWWRMSLSGAKFAYVDDAVLIRNWLPTGLSRLSVVACNNEINRLDDCLREALQKHRSDLIPYLNTSYQKTWRNLIQQYGKIGNRRGVMDAYHKSLKYGFNRRTFLQFIRAIIRVRINND